MSLARFSLLAVVTSLGLSACAPVVVGPGDTPDLPPPAQPTAVQTVSRPADTTPMTPQQAARNFVGVIQQMEPAVERECLARRTRPINCDFQFVVDDRPGQPPNAFQTQDNRGRPIIGFTISLIAAAQNTDEIAFVVGHEASHHILNHIAQRASTSTAGAVILGGIAAAASGNPAAVDAARRVGATVGSRAYSKEWELQADYMGAVMALNAGYDPVRGSQYFRRVPDPGNHILGTHPSRAQRLAQVERAVADVRSGRVR